MKLSFLLSFVTICVIEVDAVSTYSGNDVVDLDQLRELLEQTRQERSQKAGRLSTEGVGIDQEQGAEEKQRFPTAGERSIAEEEDVEPQEARSGDEDGAPVEERYMDQKQEELYRSLDEEDVPVDDKYSQKGVNLNDEYRSMREEFYRPMLDEDYKTDAKPEERSEDEKQEELESIKKRSFAKKKQRPNSKKIAEREKLLNNNKRKPLSKKGEKLQYIYNTKYQRQAWIYSRKVVLAQLYVKTFYWSEHNIRVTVPRVVIKAAYVSSFNNGIHYLLYRKFICLRWFWGERHCQYHYIFRPTYTMKNWKLVRSRRV